MLDAPRSFQNRKLAYVMELVYPSSLPLAAGIRPRYAETISDYSFYLELSSGALQNSTSVWGQNSRFDDVRTTQEDPGYWRQ
jgi:hypothetical protein